MSSDKDFADSVAEQVKRQLALDCRIGDSSGAALVVTDGGGNFPCPVITVKKKPLRLQALLADIEMALPKTGESLAIGKYTLELRQKKLLHSSGKAAALTDKEAQLLHTLAEAGSKGVAKDQLLKSVWGIEAELNTHTLETHIYRLRGKLRELAGEELIEAAEGGYKLA